MASTRSFWRRRAIGAALAAALAGAPAVVEAQSSGLDAACVDAPTAQRPECFTAVATARELHSRVGLALFGGSPVPGSASTLGMRIGSMPRMSGTGRITLVPMELPPLLDGSANEGERAWATALSGQVTVGLLGGWSPLPTVGGVGSVDLIGRLSLAILPTGAGFDRATEWGASAGVRVGLLRESFTLPGVSVTGSYGRSTELVFGQPEGGSEGWVRGGISDWRLTGAATKRLGPVGLTTGAALTRFRGDVELGYGGPNAPHRFDAEAETDRWSAFANLSWTLLIFHATVEAGWQEAPTPDGLPAGVDVNPVGWWLAGGFRISI